MSHGAKEILPGARGRFAHWFQALFFRPRRPVPGRFLGLYRVLIGALLALLAILPLLVLFSDPRLLGPTGEEQNLETGATVLLWLIVAGLYLLARQGKVYPVGKGLVLALLVMSLVLRYVSSDVPLANQAIPFYIQGVSLLIASVFFPFKRLVVLSLLLICADYLLYEALDADVGEVQSLFFVIILGVLSGGHSLLRSRREKELEVSLEAARAGNRARTRFMSNISHEIRTPLNAIMGLNDLLTATPLTDQQKEYVRSVQVSSRHLMDIINDILEFARLETGDWRLNIRDISVTNLAREILRTLGPSLKPDGPKLVSRLRIPEEQMLRTDPMCLRQILLNLLSNAIKFTQKGSVELEIRLVSPEAGGLTKDSESGEGLLSLIVTDTGTGIPPEKTREIFKPFRQADESHQRRFGGTGLGLAIVHQRVRGLGGEILIQSEVGVGTEIQVDIPVGVSEMNQETLPEALPDFGAGDGAGSTNMKDQVPYPILLVEDNPHNQLLMRQFLKIQGLGCEVSEDGQQAVDYFEDAPDKKIIILMDVQMPVLDGLEATRKIRELEQGDRPVIIGLSAGVNQSEIDECLEAGMDLFIGKPVDLNSLKEKLREAAGIIAAR